MVVDMEVVMVAEMEVDKVANKVKKKKYFGTILFRFEASRITWHGTILNHLAPPGTTWRHLAPPGTT